MKQRGRGGVSILTLIACFIAGLLSSAAFVVYFKNNGASSFTIPFPGVKHSSINKQPNLSESLFRILNGEIKSVTEKIPQPEHEIPSVRNDYSRNPETFEVTYVTYISLSEFYVVDALAKKWSGPIIVIVYYSPTESSQFTSQTSSVPSHVTIAGYVLEQPSIVPINKLKNMGIQMVSTTHFLLTEGSMVPSAALHANLMSTPEYLWRDPLYAGIIPVYECTDENNSLCEKLKKEPTSTPLRLSNVRECMETSECRPLQTTTIPMQFYWWTYINYRAMVCIDRFTELYMVMRKSDQLPLFDESINDRGFDNVERIERLRYSSFKIGQNSKDFLFRLPSIGVSSDYVYSVLHDPQEVTKQSQKSMAYASSQTLHDPIIYCDELDTIQHGWSSFRRYYFTQPRSEGDLWFPRVAVKV